MSAAITRERPSAETPQGRMEALFQHYVTTYATRNVAEIIKLHAPGGTFWLHTGGRPVQGREAIGQAFQGVFDEWPQFGFETYRVLFTDRQWILDWAATAVLRSPGGEDRPVRFDCLDVVDINDEGLITRKDTFIDLIQARAARAQAGT